MCEVASQADETHARRVARRVWPPLSIRGVSRITSMSVGSAPRRAISRRAVSWNRVSGPCALMRGSKSIPYPRAQGSAASPRKHTARQRCWKSGRYNGITGDGDYQ